MSDTLFSPLEQEIRILSQNVMFFLLYRENYKSKLKAQIFNL